MLLVNPNGPVTADAHALLWGRANRYYVPSFPGPLSIKSVLSGSASWTTDEARHDLGEASYLVINHAHPYTIEIDSREPVETFCVFFARGFVETALRSRGLASARLLDDPEPPATQTSFREALLARDGKVGEALGRVRKVVRSRSTATVEDAGVEDALVDLALALAHEQSAAARLHERIEAIKASTRDEIFRRLCVARDILDSSLDEPLGLQELARRAHLSPFHLHRHFRRTFGETPQVYRSRRRLDRAASALRSSTTPVTDVALNAGFSSLGSFSSLFKRRYGVSPLGYRLKKEQD